jgi:hypothetical protein
MIETRRLLEDCVQKDAKQHRVDFTYLAPTTIPDYGMQLDMQCCLIWTDFDRSRDREEQ